MSKEFALQVQHNLHGHVFGFKDLDGYAVCERCHCRENTEAARSKCHGDLISVDYVTMNNPEKGIVRILKPYREEVVQKLKEAAARAEGENTIVPLEANINLEIPINASPNNSIRPRQISSGDAEHSSRKIDNKRKGRKPTAPTERS